jgi:hypothetical protein
LYWAAKRCCTIGWGFLKTGEFARVSSLRVLFTASDFIKLNVGWVITALTLRTICPSRAATNLYRYEVIMKRFRFWVPIVGMFVVTMIAVCYVGVVASSYMKPLPFV